MVVAKTKNTNCEYRYDSFVGRSISLKKIDDKIHLFMGETDTEKTFPIGPYLSIIITV